MVFLQLLSLWGNFGRKRFFVKSLVNFRFSDLGNNIKYFNCAQLLFTLIGRKVFAVFILLKFWKILEHPPKI